MGFRCLSESQGGRSRALLAQAPPACRSAATRSILLSTCCRLPRKTTAPLLGLHAPPRLSQPPCCRGTGLRQSRSDSELRHALREIDSLDNPHGLSCSSAYQPLLPFTTRLPSLARARPTFLRLRRASPTGCSSDLPGLFHPGSTHELEPSGSLSAQGSARVSTTDPPLPLRITPRGDERDFGGLLPLESLPYVCVATGRKNVPSWFSPSLRCSVRQRLVPASWILPSSRFRSHAFRRRTHDPAP